MSRGLGLFNKRSGHDELEALTLPVRVSRGEVPSALQFSGTGKKVADGAVTSADVWLGPTNEQPIPQSEQQMEIVSSSASDAAGGTGVRSIHIHYIDGNGDAQRETLTPNGTTPVNTNATDILFCNCFHTLDVGSNGAAVGDIELRSTDGTATYKFMQSGSNHCRSTMRKVPSGYRLMISSISLGSSSNAVAGMWLAADAIDREPVPGVFFEYEEFAMFDSSIIKVLTQPISFEGGSIVTFRFNADKQGTFTANFTGWLEKIE